MRSNAIEIVQMRSCINTAAKQGLSGLPRQRPLLVATEPLSLSICRSVCRIFLGSGPGRGRSPVEWGDFRSSVRPFVPPSRAQEPARQALDPARQASEPARQASEPARQASEPASQACLAGSEAWLDGSKACLAGSWALEGGTDGRTDGRTDE